MLAIFPTTDAKYFKRLFISRTHCTMCSGIFCAFRSAALNWNCALQATNFPCPKTPPICYYQTLAKKCKSLRCHFSCSLERLIIIYTTSKCILNANEAFRCVHKHQNLQLIPPLQTLIWSVTVFSLSLFRSLHSFSRLRAGRVPWYNCLSALSVCTYLYLRVRLHAFFFSVVSAVVWYFHSYNAIYLNVFIMPIVSVRSVKIYFVVVVVAVAVAVALRMLDSYNFQQSVS